MFRLRFIALALVVVFAAPSGFGQNVLPRDPDKLISRVQQYWDALKADKRNAALQLVLSEDRDAFLEGAADGLVKDVQITALELTGDRNKARVGVAVTQFLPGAADFLHSSFSDQWVWHDNNWYRHIPGQEEKAASFARAQSPAIQKYQKEFADSLVLEGDVFDAGTLARGPTQTLHVPINYSGKWDLSVETLPPVTFIHTRLDNMAPPIRDFPLYIDTSRVGDEFSVPVRLRFWSGVALVEKTLTVKGKAFSAVSFRSSAELMVPGKPFSVFVKNNSDETAEVQYFTTNDDFNIVSAPMEIPPHKEAEVVLEIVPERKPQQLGLLLKKPVGGLSQFVYRFSAVP